MSEEEFVRLVATIRPIGGTAALDAPLNGGPLDSLDLLELRCALESRLDRWLSDERFIASSTLRDLYRVVSAWPMS